MRSSDAGPTERTPAAAPKGGPTPDREQAAAAAFERAISLYAKGDVKGALESMQTSYQLSARPELLFNLARLERELQQCEVAQRDYALYLKDVPQGSYRAAAQQGVQELDRDCVPSPSVGSAGPGRVASSAAGTPAAADLAPTGHPEPYWTVRRTWGWSAVGAGAVAGGLAIYLEHLAVVKNHQLESLRQRQPVGESANHAWKVDQFAAMAVGVATGALLATGAFLVLVDTTASNGNRASAQFYALPGCLGASYSRSF